MKRLILFFICLLFIYEAQAQTFQRPVANPRIACNYAQYGCASAEKAHTGEDYSAGWDTPILAVADGEIVQVEYMHAKDHGMGNNLIISHKLSNNEMIYSTYSHLNGFANGVSIGSKVKVGQTVGFMGASGYGKSDTWMKGNRNPHLHFELKKKATSQSPWGGSFWGYTPNQPDTYGYINPADYYGKITYQSATLSNNGGGNSNPPTSTKPTPPSEMRAKYMINHRKAVIVWKIVTNANAYRIHVSASSVGWTSENGLPNPTVNTNTGFENKNGFVYYEYQNIPKGTYYYTVRVNVPNVGFSNFSPIQSFTVE